MTRRGTGRGRREAGLSLVELMIAIVVLVFAILALFSLMTSSTQVERESREKTLAYNAARLKIEEMRNKNFVDIYKLYNSFDNSETRAGIALFAGAPASTNAEEPGSSFDVSGLNKVPTDAAVGRILFPEDGTTEGLKENLSDTVFGTPRDLNQDGDSADVNVVDYTILPVKIRVRWQGVGGKTTEIEVSTLITSK